MPEKFLVYVTAGDKETVREFNTLDEAWDFVPQALKLKEKAPGLKVRVRKRFSKSEIVEPHFGEPLYDKDGMIMNPFTNLPMRKVIYFGPRKGKWYCPVDGFYTTFKQDNFLGLKVCEHCGISENDWYVRTINGLWKT